MYSYDPSLINDGSLNQLRFELGDVFVLEPEKTAYLTDEEILNALDGSRSFKRAKLRLVETLLMRFSYEVTLETHETKWQLSDRADFWKGLHKKLKAELDAEDFAKSFGFSGKKQRPPIFGIGMNDFR